MDFDFSSTEQEHGTHHDPSLARQRQAPAGILRDATPQCGNHHRVGTDNDNNNYNNDQHDHEHHDAYDPVVGSFLLPLQRRPTLMAAHRTRGVRVNA